LDNFTGDELISPHFQTNRLAPTPKMFGHVRAQQLDFTFFSAYFIVKAEVNEIPGAATVCRNALRPS
jgi:hypothetical protein